MNRVWISEMFRMEPEDERELANVEPAIQKGGQIFFALDDGGAVMACCMIAPRQDGDWEIMKFAARGMYTGTGAGSACLKACIDYTKKRGLPSLQKFICFPTEKLDHDHRLMTHMVIRR